MSTRANIILITPDSNIHQYYHHHDGYFSGVGEELRKAIVYSIGINAVNKEKSVYENLVIYLGHDREYQDEYKLEQEDHNRLHADIEYLYIIKDTTLYGCHAWDMYEKVKTNKDLLDRVCIEKNILPLDRHLNDD